MDDQFWIDVVEVALRLGDRDRAVGMALRWIQLGQMRFKEDKVITVKEFDEKFDRALIPEFAKINGEYVEVVGAAEQFAWLLERRAAGQRGGQKKAANAAAKRTDAPPSSDSDNLASSKTQQTYQTLPSSSYSSSPSYSSSASDSKKNKNNTSAQSDLFGNSPPPPASANKDLNRKIWEAYAKAYWAKYKLEPTRNAMVNKQVDNLRARAGEDAVDLVKFYVEHRDKFYVSKQHAIAYCLKDAESLITQMKRNKPVTHVEMKEYERRSGNMQLLEEIRQEREANKHQGGNDGLD